jgi:hypothetical protein
MHFGESHELCFALCYRLKTTGICGDEDPLQILRGYLDTISTDFKLHNGSQYGIDTVTNAKTNDLLKQLIAVNQTLL